MSIYDNNRVGGLQNSGEKAKDGWQQSSILVSGNTNKNLTMQANFPESDTYTVQFGIKHPTNPTSPIKTKADIFWAVEGSEIHRQISVGNGISISGTAQGVKVIVTDETNLLAVGQEYLVTTQITRGSRASTEQPPVRSDTDNTTGTGSGPETIEVDIPQNIGVISAEVSVVNVTNTGTIVLPSELVVQQGNPLVVGSFKVYDPDIYIGFVPISPQATRLRLVFSDPDVTHTHTWSITWGIDG